MENTGFILAVVMTLGYFPERALEPSGPRGTENDQSDSGKHQCACRRHPQREGFVEESDSEDDRDDGIHERVGRDLLWADPADEPRESGEADDRAEDDQIEKRERALAGERIEPERGPLAERSGEREL